jgi:hypothetical protein
LLALLEEEKPGYGSRCREVRGEVKHSSFAHFPDVSDWGHRNGDQNNAKVELLRIKPGGTSSTHTPTEKLSI